MQCMTPVIFEGENVIVTPVPFLLAWRYSRVPYGDTGLRIHRLIAYRFKGRSLQLLTRGDRSECFDAPIHLDQVIGKVKAVSSRGGRDSLRQDLAFGSGGNGSWPHGRTSFGFTNSTGMFGAKYLTHPETLTQWNTGLPFAQATAELYFADDRYRFTGLSIGAAGLD